MRGPIDFIIVEFQGNKFDGSILAELEKATNDGAIDVLDLALLTKDENGEVASLDVTQIDDAVITTFITSNGVTGDLIGDDDLDEAGELLENNTSAGLLIVEHTQAKGLKQAIINANGTLISEGRIHPDAARELDNEGQGE